MRQLKFILYILDKYSYSTNKENNNRAAFNKGYLMDNKVEADLNIRKTQLQLEIVSIQDEIEMLHVLLDRYQAELDDVQHKISDASASDNVAA